MKHFNLIPCIAIFLTGSVAFAQSNVQEVKTTNPSTSPVKVVQAKATPAPPPTTQNGELSWDMTEYNFGTIKMGEVVTHEYRFTNTGKEPIIITSANGSCGCTVPDYPKEPIKKGETGVIKVSFNSAGKTQMQDKTVTVSSNAKGSPHILHIKGMVEPGSVPSPGK